MSNGPRWLAVGGDLRRSERCLAGVRGRTSKLTINLHLSILGAHAAQVVVPGAWAVGELIGAVCKGHGRMGASYDLSVTKTGSGAQNVT